MLYSIWTTANEPVAKTNMEAKTNSNKKTGAGN